MSDDDINRWVTSQALQGLRGAGLKAGNMFTRAELCEWTGLKPRQASSALRKLMQWKFLTHSDATYTVNLAGAAAIAAASAEQHKSGPKAPHAKDRALAETAFVARLWKLLRMKKILDCDTAASTLVDAGDAEAYKRTQRTASRYLNRWAKTDAVKAGANTPRGVCKRYVLQIDSPTPPAWTAKALARKELT